MVYGTYTVYRPCAGVRKAGRAQGSMVRTLPGRAEWECQMVYSMFLINGTRMQMFLTRST
jgi:hypothetical protein